MLEGVIKSIFWDISTKRVKEYSKLVTEIRKKEKFYSGMSLDDIMLKTAEFKAKFEGLDYKNEIDAEKIREILEEIKVDAFALVCYTCSKLNGKSFPVEYAWGKKVDYAWNMLPYDVQLIWGLVLHNGDIAEMRTGEWKTLVATFPLYLNSLTWNTVHLVTANDYLADRDAKEMGILYKALGLTVGVVGHSQSIEDKKNAYNSDIVYATNNELGFDYLRDNMAHNKDSQAQSKLFFAVVDEVDSILIDEARTPLIVSAPDNEPTTKYLKFAKLSMELKDEEHYKIDEKGKTAVLTEDWIRKVEDMLGVENIYTSAHYSDVHHIENALKAMTVYRKDIDYIVHEGEVMIVDETTWRVLPGRRFSEGLHQALEAKEGVTIKQESITLASTTFQNYFRLYHKLAGMTWTALTEREEFLRVYNLDVIEIPTNKPVKREDRPDLLFKSEVWKFKYLAKLVKELNESGRPILIWTISVAKSEYLSKLLKEEGIVHNVLNAKNHSLEAEIISKAGQKGAITIATNMAWRWTDIKLWDWVRELWGLIIIWTEKHDSRRIDNQLRGRSWRQGDPWMTQFLVSPNDDIMVRFGWDKLGPIFNSPVFASIPEDEPLIESKTLTSRITSVQKQVEGYHFDTRKYLLEYDDVATKHREVIYSRRNKVLRSDDLQKDYEEMIFEQVKKFVVVHLSDLRFDETPFKAVDEVNKFLSFEVIHPNDLDIEDYSQVNELSVLADSYARAVVKNMNKIKDKFEKEEHYLEIKRRIMLQTIDTLWTTHINKMSALRSEVSFAGYAQKNPLMEYKKKAYEMFTAMLDEVSFKAVKAFFSIRRKDEIEEVHPNVDNGRVSKEEEAEILRQIEQAKKAQEQQIKERKVHRV